MNSKQRSLFVVGIGVILFVGCTSSTDSEGDIFVPVDTNMPYAEYNYSVISTDLPQNATDGLPRGARMLKRYFRNPDDFREHRLSVDYKGDILMYSLTTDRLMILDKQDNRLIDYHLSTDTAMIVATFGRGPGELAFSEDLAIQGESVFVARADRQISQFRCTTEKCEYAATVRVPVEATSLTVVGSDSIAVFGSPIVSDVSSIQLEYLTESGQAVRVITKSGEHGHSFGSAYDTDGHWMLLRPLVSKGSVRFIEKGGNYILEYAKFPYLYLFDRGGNLIDGFKFANFEIGKQKYSTRTGALEIVLVDHDTISSVMLLDDDFVIIEITSKLNNRVEDMSFVWDVTRKYFGFRASNKTFYFLGSTEDLEEPNTSLTVVTSGLVLNSKGVLSHLEIK